MKELGKDKNRKITDDIKISKNTITNDMYDKLMFKEIKKSNPKIKETEINGSSTYAPFKELHQDLFDALYKYDPKKIPDSSIAYTHLLNSKIMDAILESPKYKELRNLTRLDQIAATVGTEVMGDEVKEMIKELQEEFEKAVEEYEKSMEGQGESEETDEEGEEGEPKSGKGKSPPMSYEEAKKQLEEFSKKTQELVQKQERRAINKIIEKASNQAQATSDMISNWGLEQSNSFTRSNYQDKLKMLERLRNSEKLKKIAELAGRYKRMAVQTQKEKVKKGMDEVYDIVPGNDLGRLLASEAMKLLHPVTKLLFKKDFLEGRLLQYHTSGKEKKCKGAVIICIDDSGSMAGASEIWAKAVALGVLEICRIQKRDMYVIHFDDGRKESLHCNFFSKNNYDVDQIIDMAEYFTGGGTQFEPSLDLARDKINLTKEFTKASILFITDGMSAIRDSWLKKFLMWKKEKNVDITSILIDSYGNSDSCVKTFSDKIEKLSTIRKNNSDDLAVSLFSNI